MIGRLRTRLAGADRVHYALLAVIVVIGVAVRAAFLGEPMRYDEAFTFLRYAMAPDEAIRRSYDLPNNHVLNTLMIHWTWMAAGVHMLTVRLPAFVLGSLVPVAAYLAGRELSTRRAGLWAAALTAGFGPLVEFSVNGRGYAPAIFFLVLALWAGARILHGSRLWPVPVFVLCAVLAMYSVPTAAYGLGAVGLFLGASALARRRPDWRALLALAVCAALTVGLTALLYKPLQGQPGWTIQPPLPDLWAFKRDMMRATWEVWNRTTPGPMEWLVAAGFVASLVAALRPGHRAFPLALAAVLALGGVLLSSRLPPFPRGYVALLPVYLIAAAIGLAWLIDLVSRRVRRAELLNGALAVLAALALSAGMLGAGLRGGEAPPQSDEAIVPYLRDDLRAEEVVMNQFTFAPATNFYFLRDGYPGGRGNVTPAMLEKGSATVIVQGDRPEEASGTVASVGGRPAPRPPKLLKRFEYVSVWDVPLQR